MKTHDEPIEYWIDGACIGFEDDLVRLMERAEMSRADLAREYGASTAFISKVLNGSSNYTLKTMAKLGRAVRGILQVRLIHEDDEVVRVLTFDEAEVVDAVRGERRPPHPATAPVNLRQMPYVVDAGGAQAASDSLAEVVPLRRVADGR